MLLKIEYDGQVYEFDDMDLDVDEAETIQKYAGRSLGDWANGLETCEVKSVTALWWLLRKRAGQNPGATVTAKTQGFKPVRLFNAYADALKAEVDRLVAEQEEKEQEEQEAAGPDPTRPPADSSPASASTTMPAPASAAPLQSPPG